MRPQRTDVHPWCEATTLGDLLLKAAPEADAVVFPEERWTFGELAERARTFARGLIGLGIEAGDRVGVLMANSPDAIASIFGIALAGATVVPINTRYRAVELPFVVSDAGVRAILTSDRIDDYVDLLGLLTDALPDLSALSVVALGAKTRPGTISEPDFLALADQVEPAELEFRRAAVRLRDDALLLYTSGTTSLPRGCRLTHEAIVRNWMIVARILDLRAGDRMWAPCPLFHLGAIGPLIACAAAGAAFVSDTFFQPQRALDLVQRERATHLYPAYPPITQGLIDQPAFAAADLSSARAMLNVGPEDLLRQMQAALPHVVQLTLYGSTEGGGAITYSQLDDDLDTRVATCGHPLPGCEVRVAEDGEILVRSFGLFTEYLNDPEKSAAAFDADGWYRTGDRGALGPDGRLRFMGRLKDMLKVGGENVAAAEIESLLSTHPAVKLVQVVGVPDARLEEVPAAFVELRAGRQATAEELIAFCAERIARFKVPRHVRFVSAWPMSATKIQKGPLRERLLAELEEKQTVA
jgi:fatty-acyl-CoA synthase